MRAPAARSSRRETAPGGAAASGSPARGGGVGPAEALDFESPLARTFYDRSTVQVAQELLGTFLVHRLGAELRAARLVETEAYVSGDPASHAYRGPTARNRSMFAEPGTLYVFRIHQVFCANAVTRPGEAVLLRAAAPVLGRTEDTRGPGRLCRTLAIDRSDDGSDLTSSEVRILPGERWPGRIVRTPRVGIRQAAERRLRFSVAGHPWVSRPTPSA